METQQMTVSTDFPRPPGPRFARRATDQQLRTLHGLGVSEASVRQAAIGLDLFAYVEDDYSTLRLQIGPDGGVVGQTVLAREPSGAERLTAERRWL